MPSLQTRGQYQESHNDADADFAAKSLLVVAVLFLLNRPPPPAPVSQDEAIGPCRCCLFFVGVSLQRDR